MAFLKKFDIKQICVVNHQEINILSNFGSSKTKNREMIGRSVKDFGSFYQKTLEPIFSKDRKTSALEGGYEKLVSFAYSLKRRPSTP